MTLSLMPKATAVWLVENTGLTFRQIADWRQPEPDDHPYRHMGRARRKTPEV